MRILSYSIEIDDVQDVHTLTPVMKYCGVYPSEAFKTPQELAQSILDVLNEEYGLDMTVVSCFKITEDDTESTVSDLDSIKARQDRIAKNKRELGYE